MQGEKGRFFLMLDSARRKVRFLDAQPAKDRFSVLTKAGREIVILYCLECDISATVRWDKGRKRFVVR